MERRKFSDKILALMVVALLITAFGCSGGSDKIPVTTTSEEARQLFLEGQDLYERLRHPEAHEYFQQAVEKDPDFALAHLYLADLQPTATGLFEELDKALTMVDSVSEGERLMILAIQARINAEPVKRREYYTQLVAVYPKDELAHSLLGTTYFHQQEYEKAIEEFRKTVKIEAECSAAYNLLGYAYRYLGNYVEAEKAFREYIELIPNDPNPYDSYAELLMKMGKYGESIESYYKALELDPGFFNSHIGIATNLNYLGKHRHARDELQEMYESAANDMQRREALHARAVSYVDEGYLDEAVRELEKSYELSNDAGDRLHMSGSLKYMGIILLEDGKHEEAAAKFKESLEIILESDLSKEIRENAERINLFLLGRTALTKKDLETAKSKLEEFQKRVEIIDNPALLRLSHRLAGMIALEEDDYEKALEELMQADQHNPYNLYRIGLAYQGQGENVKAKEWLEKAANYNALNSLEHAFIRNKARKLAAVLQDVQS